jgi:hypothetical protein
MSLGSKWLLGVLLGVLIVLLVSLQKSNSIRYGVDLQWKQIMNVHESPVTWLQVKGKKYSFVKGQKPFHLASSDGKWIFFVTTDRLQKQFKYHFLLLREDREFVIPVDFTYLGNGIGTASNYYRHDWIHSVAWPNVVIASRLDTNATYYTFDLSKLSVHEASHPNGAKAR